MISNPVIQSPNPGNVFKEGPVSIFFTPHFQLIVMSLHFQFCFIPQKKMAPSIFIGNAFLLEMKASDKGVG